MITMSQTKSANYLFIVAVLKSMREGGVITLAEYERAKRYYAGMDERVHGSAAGIQLLTGRTPWMMCPMKQALPSVNLLAWIKQTSFLVEL